MSTSPVIIFFFFNDTATTEIYTLSLHDALPISAQRYLFDVVLALGANRLVLGFGQRREQHRGENGDRKSTRLNSSHSQISYAVFCLKKKKIAIYDQDESRVLPMQSAFSLTGRRY